MRERERERVEGEEEDSQREEMHAGLQEHTSSHAHPPQSSSPPTYTPYAHTHHVKQRQVARPHQSSLSVCLSVSLSALPPPRRRCQTYADTSIFRPHRDCMCKLMRKPAGCVRGTFGGAQPCVSVRVGGIRTLMCG